MKIISGGQTGVDHGALRAAKAAGLETGGWMPRRWLTENGPRPEYAQLYGLKECPVGSYPERTRRNIEDSDMTLILAGDDQSPGTQLTVQLCRSLKKPFHLFDPVTVTTAQCIQALADVAVLNIAGNRESSSPGIERWTERFLGDVFAALEIRR